MVTVTVITIDNNQIFQCEEGSNLLEQCMKQGIEIPNHCNKKGTCGFCKVLIKGDNAPISKEEEKLFSKEELKKGYRLCCKQRVTSDVTVDITCKVQKEERVLLSNVLHESDLKAMDELGFAVDIGTTTVAVALMNLTTKEVVDEIGFSNPQRTFGADVTARISYGSQKEGLIVMEKEIKKAIHEAVETLLKRQKLASTCQLKKMAIAANPTMLHILQGFSTKSLGEYPFTPVSLSYEVYSYQELFGDAELSMEVELLPGFSSFVGADILAGVLYVNMDQSEKKQLFIDLGTNGEMIIGERGRMISTSCAAGPAFEAAFKSQGLHGSRMIDLMAQYKNARFIDEEGTIIPRYFEKGIPCQNGVSLTQSMIREIQLAKSAVRTGIDILAKEYGCNLKEIEQVYLAGGFGFHLKLKAAYEIGLLPKEFAGKVQVVGNTSILGAKGWLEQEDYKERAKAVVEWVKNINLANHKDFHKLFVEHMKLR